MLFCIRKILKLSSSYYIRLLHYNEVFLSVQEKNTKFFSPSCNQSITVYISLFKSVACTVENIDLV